MVVLMAIRMVAPLALVTALPVVVTPMDTRTTRPRALLPPPLKSLTVTHTKAMVTRTTTDTVIRTVMETVTTVKATVRDMGMDTDIATVMDMGMDTVEILTERIR